MVERMPHDPKACFRGQRRIGAARDAVVILSAKGMERRFADDGTGRGPGHKPQRNHFRDHAPVMPVMYLGRNIGPAQKYKFRFRVMNAQLNNAVHAAECAPFIFQITDDDARMRPC